MSRCHTCWKTCLILLAFALFSVIVLLAHYYVSNPPPMECYHCNWVMRPNGPLLANHTCGRDQRNVPNATVKTCATGVNYCGTLHISFSYRLAGESRQVEFAFVRDCFPEYPLPYLLQFDGTNRTYYGSRDGTVYANVAGLGLNMTLTGNQCSPWSKCNSNVPKDSLGLAFLDSVTVIDHAKQKGLNAWNALVDQVRDTTGSMGTNKSLNSTA